MTSVSAGQQAAPARSDPLVRATVRRAGRRARRWLIVGVLLLTGFLAPLFAIDNASDALRQHGGQTAGVVLVLVPDRYHQDGRAFIRYLVDGRQHTGVQDLGSDASRYQVGETVTVYYDRTNPGRFTINDEVNQPVWSVYLMILAMMLSPVGFILAGIFGLRWRRLRRILSSCAWQTARFEPALGLGLVRVQLIGPDGAPTGEDVLYRYRARTAVAEKLFGRPTISSPINDPGRRRCYRSGRLAGPHRRWVVLAGQRDGAALVLARRQSG